MNLQPETEFFHDIAPKVRALVQSFNGKASVAKYKDRTGDFATEIDVAVEELIVSEIHKRFPNDAILAEEGHSETKIPDSRIWIIDPICGTTNLGRGLTSFCSNIALADKRELIASCVVDHSQNDYFWSVGNNEVYINDKLLEIPERHEQFGLVIDADFGALDKVRKEQKEKHFAAALKLSSDKSCMLQSLNSSLPFAYTAISKIDGFINVDNHPWDVCAGSFLVQQSGGVITAYDGSPWTLESVGAIAAHDPAVHKKLLDAFV